MMKTMKTNIIVCAFMLFLALCIVGTSTAILNTPVEITSGTAGNYTVNLTNGGYVLEDNGFLFFTSPFKKGIYRVETSKPNEAVKINDEGEGFLQRVDSSYYYSDDNVLKRCDIDGEGIRTIIPYASKPLVSGGTVFYLDENSNLCKYSFQTKTSKIIVEKEKSLVKSFVVYYKRIYYTDEKGNIRKVAFDGRENELFLDVNANSLSIDGQYIFYISDGYVWSAMISKDKLVKAKIIPAEQYAVYGEYIIYTNNNKVYHADINDIIKNKEKAKIKNVFNSSASGISIDDDYFYFFADNGELIRLSHNSDKKTNIIMKGGK